MELTMELENEGPAKVTPGDFDSDDLFFASILPEYFSDAVDQASADAGVTGFWSYCRGDEDDPDSAPWHDPDAGLKTATALIAHFEADHIAFQKDPWMEGFVGELRALAEALREAKRRGQRFRLFLNT